MRFGIIVKIRKIMSAIQYHTLDNEALFVRDLSKGNLLAFNTLYKEYSHRLYRFAIGYLKSEAEAEELVQEVFTIIWEKRADLKAELSFKSFLFTIAYNIIKKHFRTKCYLTEYFKSGKDEDFDMQTSNQITFDSLNQYIADLVNMLPPRRKEIFIKSRVEGLSIKEIAENMNISHKTVENQLTDTLKFIRTSLNRESLPSVLFFVLFISL
ncbi:MAG TPA: RNA polymerase sigma-70 factor [Bacteroidales bacterium]|nr:RNA polymerase sigma-70 factor [Bacteroidales bacterium]